MCNIFVAFHNLVVYNIMLSAKLFLCIIMMQYRFAKSIIVNKFTAVVEFRGDIGIPPEASGQTPTI